MLVRLRRSLATVRHGVAVQAQSRQHIARDASNTKTLNNRGRRAQPGARCDVSGPEAMAMSVDPHVGDEAAVVDRPASSHRCDTPSDR